MNNRHSTLPSIHGTSVCECRSDVPVSGLMQTPRVVVSAIRRVVTGYRRRRASIKALQRLSDRELRDIGIRRESISDVVDGLEAHHGMKAADLSPRR